MGIVAFYTSSNNRAENASVDFKKVKEDIVAAVEADEDKRSNGTSMAPTLIRLAWHASGTYSMFDKTGGSNGATMRFAPECSWGANAGLKSARDFLEPIKRKHNISYADLWTLSGGKNGINIVIPEIALTLVYPATLIHLNSRCRGNDGRAKYSLACWSQGFGREDT